MHRVKGELVSGWSSSHLHEEEVTSICASDDVKCWRFAVDYNAIMLSANGHVNSRMQWLSCNVEEAVSVFMMGVSSAV